MTATSLESSIGALLTTAAAASDGDVLARAAQDGLLADLQALRVAIYAADPDGSTLRMVGHSGGDEVRRLYSTLPVDDATPNAVAFRTGTELFLTLDDASDQYPLISAAAAVYADQGDLEIGFLPLRHAGEPVGVVGLLFGDTLPHTWESRATLDALCAILGLWCAAHRADVRALSNDKPLTLTARQRDVLRLAAAGLTNAQISVQLGFAESTVKADLTALYRLTGARSRPDLLARTADLT